MADKKVKKVQHHYENNPFFITSNGITLFANLARGVFVLFLVFSLISILADSFSPDPKPKSFDSMAAMVNGWSVHDWTLIIGSGLVIGLAVAMLFALFSGVSAYTSYKLSQNKQVFLSEAFREAFDNLWSYLWLQIIITVKIILWTLLLVIPGIIMSVRYSLAGVAFFDEKKKLRGNAAIQESLRLTRGAWITTYAAHNLFNFLTLYTISSVVSTAANATLYKQFTQTGDKKPDAHWLSWLALIAPIVLFILGIFLTVIIAVVIAVLGIKAL
jgi:hypothetical protein